MSVLLFQALSKFHMFRGDRKAVTAMEYGLIAALEACGIITALTTLAGGLTHIFSGIGTTLTGISTSS